MKTRMLLFLALVFSCVMLLGACAQEEGGGEISGEPILFPEASEECVKAKAFYGYYILQDSDVIFAMNEDESRFCVTFNAMAGNRPVVLTGDVVDGLCTVDPHCNGLFGEDIQMMYEDALAEEAPWSPIVRE